MAYGVSKAGWIAAHTAIKTLICTGGIPTVVVLNSSDALLAEATLDCASSSVDADGKLTFVVLDQEGSAPLGGTADHAEIRDGAGVVVFELPCQQGTAPVAGTCVINTLSIVAGAPVDFLSVEVPPGATIA